jgi:putative toxin-antitoxin system antitoxin component (TIGR02293 family)
MRTSAAMPTMGKSMSPRVPVEIVAAGLPYSLVESLCMRLDLSVEELCRLLPISRRTLARYRGKTLDSRLSDHLMMIEQVFKRAVEVLGSLDNARIWLKTPNYAFSYQRPLDYLATFTGSQELLDELGRLQHGIFV